MKNKLIIFSIAILVISASVGVYFAIKNNNKKVINTDSTVGEIVEIYEEPTEENNIDTEQVNNNQIIENSVEVEIPKSPEVVIENKTTVPNNNTTNTNKNTSSSTNTSSSNTKTQPSTQNPTPTPIQPIEQPKEQPKPPEQDQEYLNALKQVEYKTFEEAKEAGFEKSFEDTVNIKGFNVKEVIYKGQVLGYILVFSY